MKREPRAPARLPLWEQADGDGEALVRKHCQEASAAYAKAVEDAGGGKWVDAPLERQMVRRV
jgi:hypothetical protein